MRSQSFVDKVAIVTGGARGIGAAVVQGLVEQGAAVVIADMLDEGEKFAVRLRSEGFKTVFVKTDVTQISTVRQTVEAANQQFGGVDMLVNCAGVFPRGSLLQTDERLWDLIMDVNLKGVFLCCKEAVPAMILRGRGAIVNIGSNHANAGGAELFAYAVSKGGLLTLTRNLARSLSVHQIRVNCVNPGWVATEGEIALREASGQSLDWLREQGRKSPLGRLQTSEDIASAVIFLLSEQANQITGQIISVDGGSGFR